MKIQHLAIVFLLIILPIDIVLGLYLDAQINTIRNQAVYDSKLVGCVYDALEVYQSNSIVDTENNIVTAKMNNIEASASTFLTSLQSAFGYSGYKATVMQEYVPAVVYTMYDGYYIYSKFNNTLSETNVYMDSSFTDGITIEGLKSYVFYSCRYQKGNDDFVITYTLDNYITIQGNINGNYINESGYLIDGIEKIGEIYKFDGIYFDKSGIVDGNRTNTEEYIGDDLYRFVKINGTKYYYDSYYNDLNKAVYVVNNTGYESIFHILNGKKVVQVTNTDGNESLFNKYKAAIDENKNAYFYYKEAYEFTNRIRNELGLKNLNASDAVYKNPETGNLEKIKDFGNYKIFGKDSNLSDNLTGDVGGPYIQDSDSEFNRHRAAVIRYTVETNLRAAISGFSNFSDQLEFAMPKISEENWETIENNSCVIGFLQGLDIGTKKYNGYAVVANTTTNEYVDENSIYIIADNQYNSAKANDISGTIKNTSGIFKMDFERHYIKNSDDTTIYYYPQSPSKDDIYSASYSSIINQTAVNNEYADIYKYMRDMYNTDKTGYGKNSLISKEIKRAYYIALARERYGSYKMNHDINYEYFLKNY